MGPYGQPGPGVDRAVDQVKRMGEILRVVRAGPAADLTWTRRRPGSRKHVLAWTENGAPKEYQGDDLRKVADWAEKKWLAARMPHAVLVVKDSAYSVKGPNDGRPAILGWPSHYPMEAICSVCGQVVRREKMDPGNLDWVHTGRMPGDPR